ncbi:MAG: winged helix-turn-helix domain-containing protein [Patescibacteria group bacterium]|nr:winged helix-turn-helix domain-containing protein [Patescibacteria group bacterium]
MPVELKVRDIVLNTATRKVTRAGEELILTFKEFMILEYFMRHSGRVVIRDQLYANRTLFWERKTPKKPAAELR